MRRTVHEGAINAIAWQPGQARVATAGEDGAVRILQVGADEPLVVVRPSRRTIDVIGWSPKGDMLAVAKADAGLLFGADGKQIRRIPAVDSTITGLTWSPDGGAIAVLVLRRRARDRSEHGRAPAAPAGQGIDAQPRLEPGWADRRVRLPGQQRARLALPAGRATPCCRGRRSSRAR